jgi:hypothetical protein
MSSLEAIVAKSITLIKDKKLTSPTSVIATIMSVVTAANPDMSGANKKTLVLEAISAIASAEGLSAIPLEVLEDVKDLLDRNALGEVIDVLVDASKGKFDFGKIVKAGEDSVDSAKDVVAIVTDSVEIAEKTAETVVSKFKFCTNVLFTCFKKPAPSPTPVERKSV